MLVINNLVSGCFYLTTGSTLSPTLGDSVDLEREIQVKNLYFPGIVKRCDLFQFFFDLFIYLKRVNKFFKFSFS